MVSQKSLYSPAGLWKENCETGLKGIQLWVAPENFGSSGANSLSTQCWTWKHAFPTFSVSTWNLLIPCKSEHLYFILASKWAHEPLSLIVYISCVLNHDWASESRKSQLHLLMGKSGDKRTDRVSCAPALPCSQSQHLQGFEIELSFSTVTDSTSEVFWHLDFAVDENNQNLFIPKSQKSWRKGTEPGTLEHGLSDGISGQNKTFYIRNLKELFFDLRG